MLSLLPLVGWAVLGIVVLQASRYIAVLLSLRRLRFSPVAVPEHIALDDVPSEQRRLLALAAPRLRELGFTPDEARRMPSTLVCEPPRLQYAHAWLHEASGAWATVALRDEPEYGNLYLVNFYTFYASTPHLFTTARRAHEQVTVHPDFAWIDTQGDLVQQWQTHLERMQARPAVEVERDRASFAALERRLPAEVRAVTCAAGLLKAAADGTAQFTWRGAWRLLHAYRHGLRELARHPLAPALANGVETTDPLAAELRASADAIALGNALAARRHEVGRSSKGLWLLATGLVSLLLFRWQFDWTFAWVLVMVLLVHELGHLLVMRWAGYRDLQVFFIPLFGAIASGRHERVPAWKKMLVLLAGPLPGVLLGCALVRGLITHAIPGLDWLYVMSSTLVIVNMFNLLPLVPLDGGRLLDLLVFTRAPRLSVVFSGLGAFALVVAGVWFSSPLMSVLGCVLIFALPAQLRQARLLASLRTVHSDDLDEESQWLRKLSEILSAPGAPAMGFAQRMGIARGVAAGGLSAPPPLTTTLIGLLLYGASLVLPFWMLTELGMDLFARAGGGRATASSPAVPRDFERELKAATSDEARIALLFDAASEAESEEDFPRARDYYRRAATLAAAQPAFRTQHVQALIGVARSGEGTEADNTELEGLLGTLVDAKPETRLLRAAVLSELGFDFSTETANRNLERAEEVVGIRAALLPADDALLLEARRAYAWRLWQAARGDEAVTQLRARAQAVNRIACDADCVTRQGWMRRQLYTDLGWLLLALGKPDEAARLGQDYPGLRVTAAKWRFLIDDSLTVLDAWVSAAKGQPGVALASMAALLDTDALQGGALAELQWRVDLACFAAQAGDRAAADEWAANLRERATELRSKYPRLSLVWIKTARDTPYAWNRPRLDQELDWLQAHEPALLSPPP